jgi:outer membrane protein assembly factor BamA
MTAPIRLLILAILCAGAVASAFAQESLPEETSQQPSQANDAVEDARADAPTDRVVEHRPALYSLRREAHPLSWLELGVRPFFRIAQSPRVERLLARKPGVLRFGIGGMGSGSGFGPSATVVHEDLFGRGIRFEMPLLFTYRQYESYRVNTSIPLVSGGSDQRLSFKAGAGYISRAQDNFFGVGNETAEDDQAKFRAVTREVSAGFGAKLNDDWKAELGGVYRRVGVTKPVDKSGENLSVQDDPTKASVPGLFGGTLGTAGFAIGRNTKVIENNAFGGGSDEFAVSFNESLDGSEFRYWRYRWASEHFVRLTGDGRKVLALRGLLESNHGRIPFFDMPDLGSADTLRGFENFRFRDKNALALTLEYRYRIWPKIDWGLFIDEGQVAPSLGDLALDRFHTGYGVRLFVWPKPNAPISFDYGRSREMWRLYVNFSTRF